MTVGYSSESLFCQVTPPLRCGPAYYTDDILLFHVTSQIVHFPSHRFAVMRPRERVAKDRSQVVHTGPNVKIESGLH
jgi:hypothetical protein